MTLWKFTCTWDTERECMIRRLFGNHEKTTGEGEPLAVEENDKLLLHRMMRKDSDRHGFLLGPFVAVSDAQENIEPNAWSHIGGINWQVEIDWVETVYSLDLDDWLEKKDPPAEITQYAQKFSEVNGIYLEGQLKNEGQVIIDYP
ncbi:hypothetical protein SAMN06269185_1626 [Natronoarchaeum philippinense]|uniref:Uncharacterized protein n=1 Tax=Natronoarchaeum philippinense TaxID=558529 RepID=A0A285NS34_NATPI|nr:hypothetical protein [Natronoarchaeum philippinense]SNZ12334.1 hypothetical protein SAMN06269185_1626 [Natronoarchaeum philippinense]